MKNEDKKLYSKPEMVGYGTLQHVVLDTCGTGSGDKGTVDNGADSGWSGSGTIIRSPFGRA